MALKIGGSGSGNGVFVNRRTITGAENLSGQYNSDVTLKLYFEPVQKKDGGSFEPTMMLFANYKREDGPVDKAGKIVGWGQAFKISMLLEKVGSYAGTINDDGSIPDEALQSLVGKECFVLAYPAKHREKGTKVTNNYQLVAGLEMWDKDAKGTIPGDEWLKKQFHRELESGYVKDYWMEGEPVSAHVVTDPGF